MKVNYLAIPKPEQWNGCSYISFLGLKLIHVIKKGPCYYKTHRDDEWFSDVHESTRSQSWVTLIYKMHKPVHLKFDVCTDLM